MELRELQLSFKECALGLGEYELLTKTELANGYCDAVDNKDERKRSQYFAALMLRYWYKIFEWQVNSASLNLQPTDFVSWLSDAIWEAVNRRAWKDPTKAIYGDPNGPDKIIHQCLFSQRGLEYQYANKDKRRCNTQTFSIDAQTDENGDCALDYMGCTSARVEYDGTKDLINKLLKKDKGIEALIVDGIVNGDSFKTYDVNTYELMMDKDGNEVQKKRKAQQASFDKRKLVKHLNQVDENYIQGFFCSLYELSEQTGEDILKKLKSMDNTKLYKCIEKTLIEIKEHPKLLSCLI